MKNFFVFFFVGFMISCANDITDNKITLDIDGAEERVPSISEVKSIVLETNDTNLVGAISKVLVRNNHIYIFDRNNGKISIFSIDGRHISTIDRRGAGPQEYILPIDMDVDKNGNIFVADASKRNVVVYTPKGKFIKKIEVGRIFTGLGIIDENNIWLANVSEESNLNVKLAFFDVINKKINTVCSAKVDGEIELPMFSPSPFFRSGEKLYFYDRFSPYCFSLNNNGIMSDTIKILSEKLPNKQDVEKWVKQPQSMQTTDKITGITALYFADNSMYISFASQTRNKVLCLNNQKPIVFNSFNNDRTMHLNQVIYASYDNYMISYMPADEFISNKSFYSADLKAIATNIKPDSNPIIIMYSFK